MIKGGYILQPRIIDNSGASNLPPHVREIWLYLIRRANYKNAKVNGKEILRGQLIVTYSEILQDLSWWIGYRKMAYKKHHCETAMKALTRLAMIATARTTRGVLITILNYDYYQDNSNYETDSESYTKPTMAATREPHDKQERKNIIKKEDIILNSTVSWRNNFEVYMEQLNLVYDNLIYDKDFIKQREVFSPNLDIALSIKKAYTDFWGTEKGWLHKKKYKTEIDWKATLTKAIDLNKVYKQKGTIQAPVKQSKLERMQNVVKEAMRNE